MSTRITITLPDEIYQRAKRFALLANRDIASILADFALLANRDIASILADTIQLSIPPVSVDVTNLEPVSALSDQQVLILTELQMQPEQDARLSELLDSQQAGTLNEDERPELQFLMQIYQEGLLRKATALSEAVKRGLIQPLSQ